MILVLAVVATVLAVSSAPPRPAGGVVVAGESVAVLASARAGDWLVGDRLGVLAGVGAVGLRLLSAREALIEAAAGLRGVLGAWLDGMGGFAWSAGVVRSAPARLDGDPGAHAAWAEYLAAYSIGDASADVTGSADPFGPGSGCSDGVVDGGDLLYQIGALTRDD